MSDGIKCLGGDCPRGACRCFEHAHGVQTENKRERAANDAAIATLQANGCVVFCYNRVEVAEAILEQAGVSVNDEANKTIAGFVMADDYLWDKIKEGIWQAYLSASRFDQIAPAAAGKEAE